MAGAESRVAKVMSDAQAFGANPLESGDDVGAPKNPVGESTPKAATPAIAQTRQPTLQDVASSIAGADHVTIIGIAPIGLASALDKIILDKIGDDDFASITLKSLDYFTPLPGLVPTLKLTTPELEYEERRWLIGYQRMKAIIQYFGHNGKSGVVSGCNVWLQDCIVLVQRGGSTAYWQIGYLPANKERLSEETCSVVYCNSVDKDLERYVSEIKQNTRPLSLERLVCSGEVKIDTMVGEIPDLKANSSEKSASNNKTHKLWPIAIVIPRYMEDKSETQLLLRRRNNVDDSDGIPMLSLLSSRLIIDDLVVRHGLSNSDRALPLNEIRPKLSYLSYTNEEPARITLDAEVFRIELSCVKGEAIDIPLDEKVFRIAAQRLVLRDFGLSVESERLQFVGFVGLVKNKGPLGCAIFLVDLNSGSDGDNEIEAAERQSGASLELVKLSELNGKLSELNDILKTYLSDIIKIAENSPYIR